MVRIRWHMVKKFNPLAVAAFFALSLILTSGCYLVRYEAVMQTHLTLMEEYSTKLQYMADNRLEVSAADWVEFTYPGERAAEFLRIVGPRFEGQASLSSFQQSLILYQGLMASPDILTGQAAAAEVSGRRATLLEAIRANREALAAEQ